MAIFYTSDTHFGHQNIIYYCPERQKLGTTVEEMNEALIERWNSVVGSDDVVRVLGDFSLSMRVMEEVTPRLNGIKVLVPGNHDGCHPSHKKKADRARERYEAVGWQVTNWFTTTNIEDRRSLGPVLHMCHIPFETEREWLSRWSAEQSHPRLFKGSWLLCGHVHDRWKVVPEKRVLNVGVDVWDYFPVRFETLLDFMEEIESQLVTNG